ncbi:MAG: acyltransferase [Verrucomicrobiota bacterium]
MNPSSPISPLTADVIAGRRASVPTPSSKSHGESLPILKPLTSLRFLAALAVFFSHLGYLKNIESMTWLRERVFVEGYAGVTFFFVLSGFILTYNYHKVLTDLNLREIQSFYIARFARIYPLYLLTFLISLPLLRTQIVQQPLTFLYTGAIEVLALQSYMPVASDFAYNMPAWSLCDEFFFYALLPFVLYVLARWKVRGKNSLVLFGIGLWLTASAMVFLGRNSESAHWLFYIFPPFRLFDFALGVVCGLYFLNSSRLSFSKSLWTFWECACLTAILGMVILSSYHVPQAFRYGVYYMPIFCLTIFVFAHQGGLVSKWLSGKTWLLLGEMSFAFYMFHQLVFRYLHEVSHGKIGYVHSPLGSTLLAFVITLALSYVSFVYYETATRNWIKRVLKP